MKTEWPEVRLGEILNRVERFEARDELTEYTFAGTYSFARGIFVGERKLGSTFALPKVQRLRKGDFVYCKIMAWEGAFGLVPKEAHNCVLSGAFISYQPNRERIDPNFLDYYFKVPSHWQSIGRQSTGTNVRRQSLHPRQFESTAISLPPLAEQQRVVAKIDELAAKIREVHQLRREATKEAAALERAAVESVFRRLREQVAIRALGDVCRTITDGDHNTPEFREEGVRFIFVGNVSSGSLHFSNTKRVSLDYFRTLKAQRVPERGDILYTAVGATLGIPAVVDTDEPFCFQRHVAILKPNRTQVDSRFIWHILSSKTLFDQAWGSTTGSAQPTVPLNAIRRLPIPVPPLAEQLLIVDHLDNLKRKTDALKTVQAESAAEINALIPSILDKAFRGEL
jgi:type I restriction enzyme, S subunit